MDEMSKPQNRVASYAEHFSKMLDEALPEMREYFKREYEYIARFVNPNSRMMDVGCGPGRLMIRFAPIARQIVGVEQDEGMIAKAREIFDKAEGIPGFGKDKYDFINDNFLDVVPHSDFDIVFASYNLPGADDIKPEQRVDLLKKMVAHTKPGGDTIVSFWKPASEGWLQKYYKAAGAEVRAFKGNVVETSAGTFTRFTDEEVRSLADAVGVPYTIAHITPMFDLVHFRP